MWKDLKQEAILSKEIVANTVKMEEQEKTKVVSR